MIDIETYLLSNLWFSVGLWIVLYVADYYLTIWGARLYNAGAKEHFVFEGSYELTPQFQMDIDLLRTFSPRFFVYVVLSTWLVWLLWKVAQLPDWQALFLLPYGALVFRQLVVIVRHARNISLFRHVKEHRGVEGRISYSRWLSLELSWLELLFMALLLLMAALVAGKITLYGGALSVFMTGLKHRNMSRIIVSEIEKNDQTTAIS